MLEEVKRALLFLSAGAVWAQSPTFHRDVRPILEERCQGCHREGQMAPMPLATYAETRPWARAIREAVVTRRMPPWFADPCCGHFANDRSLTQAEIDTLARWAEAGAPEGEPVGTPKQWPRDKWNLSRVDRVIAMREPFAVPATGAVEYQYIVVPVDSTQDRWVTGVEVRPSDRQAVHHAVVYIRPAGDSWKGGPTTHDILTVYAPGSGSDVFPEGMAKLIPAGADLVLEVHYTPRGVAVEDRTEVALTFAESRPDKRVITLQMDRTDFVIPPGARNHRVTVQGTLPNDALLLGFFPHMHLRGKSFEYTLVPPSGPPETLLKVGNYDFYWQLSYRLAEPRLLRKGTRLQWIATFDNSAGNPRNPDPTVEVRYGHQSWQEMMVGFFDIAVDAAMDKQSYFVR